MTAADLLIRAGVVITDPAASPGYLTDAALLVRDRRIARLGPWEVLHREHPDARIEGGPDLVVMPALINAHDHGRGLSTLGLGIADDLLEPWILSLMRLPPLDPGLDTRLSALRQLKGGIGTTVNSYFHPLADAAMLTAVRDGYDAAGLRAGLIHSAMDQPVTGRLLRAASDRMPPALQAEIAAYLSSRSKFDMDRYEAALRETAARPGRRSWMMAGVVSGHWSTDAQITRVSALAEELNLATQMHLLESRFQATDNARFSEGSVTRHLAALGALDCRASAAHCVQMDADDIDVMARCAASVCHNLSSNLRLQSGIAPVRAMLDAGVNVALGLDSMGLNDSADMFQEIRLVHRLHGTLSEREVLSMATANGARALALQDRLGRLAEGMEADLLLLRDPYCPSPAMRSPDRVFERIVHYASADSVQSVYIGGEEVLRDGSHASLDEAELVARLSANLSSEQTETDRFIQSVVPALRDYLRAQ